MRYLMGLLSFLRFTKPWSFSSFCSEKTPFPEALVPTPEDTCPPFGHGRTRTQLRASRQHGGVSGQLRPQAKQLPPPCHRDISVILQATSSNTCNWFSVQGRAWLLGLTYGNWSSSFPHRWRSPRGAAVGCEMQLRAAIALTQTVPLN